MGDTRKGLVGAFAVGVVSWTGLEYFIHRVLGHEMRGKGLASREHLAHHADVTYFTPAKLKAVSAAGTAVVAFPAAVALTDRWRATAYTSGLLTMYFTYEVAHRRTHTHPPRGRYSRWTRRNHLLHHAGSPMRNFGVTTDWWDHLTRTHDAVPMPLRLSTKIAPVWMLDDAGAVKAEYAADYQLI